MITQGIHNVKRVTKSKTTALDGHSYSTRLFVYTDDSDSAFVLTLFTAHPELMFEIARDDWNQDHGIIDQIKKER